MPDVTIPDTPQTRTEQFLAAANGQSVTLPTPMTREEIYLNEIATKMQGGGSGVTAEPLSVTANGEYTAPSGKAYSPVMVAVPGGTKLTTTYTAAEESATVAIPMPSLQYPKRIEIRTQTQGTAIEDFSLGEIINFFALPNENQEYVNSANVCCAYRNYSTTYRTTSVLVQVYSDVLYTANTYSLLNGNLNIKMQSGGFFLPGVTYTMDWYY